MKNSLVGDALMSALSPLGDEVSAMRLPPSIPPKLPCCTGDKLALKAQAGFGLLELGVNDAAENHTLLGVRQRVRGEMDTALGQLGEVGFVGSGGQELVGVLRREPHGEAPRPALPRKLAEQASFVLLRQQQVRLIHEQHHLERLDAVLDGQLLT